MASDHGHPQDSSPPVAAAVAASSATTSAAPRAKKKRVRIEESESAVPDRTCVVLFTTADAVVFMRLQ
jgi:hypothetical protein